MFLFSVGLFVDSLGDVDDVFLDNISGNKSLIVVVSNELIADLKKKPVNDFAYINKILIFPILFKRPEDDKISNLTEFLFFSSIWPITKTNTKHATVLLQPFINDFFDPIN